MASNHENVYFYSAPALEGTGKTTLNMADFKGNDGIDIMGASPPSPSFLSGGKPKRSVCPVSRMPSISSSSSESSSESSSLSSWLFFPEWSLPTKKTAPIEGSKPKIGRTSMKYAPKDVSRRYLSIGRGPGLQKWLPSKYNCEILEDH